MGIREGMVGVGAFAQSFIPLFKAHPLVDEVVLCDLDADKLAQNADKHGIPATCYGPAGATLACKIGGHSARTLTVQRSGEVTVPDVELHRGSSRSTTIQLEYGRSECIAAVFSPTHPTRNPSGGDRVEVQCTLVGHESADRTEFECRLLTGDRSRCVSTRRTTDGKALFPDVPPGAYVVQARAKCGGQDFGPATERWIYVTR